MAEKIKFTTVEQYFESLPEEVQAILQEVRTIIAEAVPDAEEVISYNIPAFKLGKKGWIFYYSAYTKHYSLSCPPPFTFFEVFKDELSPYVQSKSTIQFPFHQPIPKALIAAMSKFRATEYTSKG